MMKSLSVLPLLATGFLFVSEANALTLDNGRNINGRNINGGSLNGRNINGLSLNGRNMNGLSFSGTAREEAASHATTVILKDGERVTLE